MDEKSKGLGDLTKLTYEELCEVGGIVSLEIGSRREDDKAESERKYQKLVDELRNHECLSALRNNQVRLDLSVLTKLDWTLDGNNGAVLQWATVAGLSAAVRLNAAAKCYISNVNIALTTIAEDMGVTVEDVSKLFAENFGERTEVA